MEPGDFVVNKFKTVVVITQLNDGSFSGMVINDPTGELKKGFHSEFSYSSFFPILELVVKQVIKGL